MLDNRGQVSFEYLMIFAISLIVLIVFTLPVTQTAIENTLDVSDSLDVKYDLSKISHAVKEVYAQGQGSKKEVFLQESKAIKIDITKTYVSCNLKLKDNSIKSLRQYHQSNLAKSSISLKKGENILVVEWPAGSESMVIYRK